MEKMYWSVLVLLISTLVACSGVITGGENNTFVLKGNAEILNDEYIYLSYESKEGIIEDSTLVVDGNFEFVGNLADFMTHGTLYTADGAKQSSVSEGSRVKLYLEATNMIIDINDKDFSTARMKGSLTQEQVDSVLTPLLPLLEEANKLQYGELRTEKDPKKLAEYKKRIEEIGRQYTTTMDNFIKTHPDSYFTAEQLSYKISSMTLEQMEEVYNALSPRVQQGKAGRTIKKEIDVIKAVAVGQPAPEFTTTDILGKHFSLSNLRGKIVLLDFWASWCVPCRKSNPHLLELYKKYHDKGLEILCVADNDSSTDAWKKAIKEDGTEAFIHVLRGLKQDSNGGFDRSTDISDKYAVHFLPTKFLIDGNGKIIGSKVNDAEIDAILKKVFNE